jgi:hypothetical protein
MTTDTLLELDFGIAPFSARNLNESFQIDDGAKQLRRTWNGDLQDLSNTSFRKYILSYDGSDILPPAFAGIWPGQTVVVKCATEVCYPVGGSPERAVVAGSSRVRDGFVYYRMQLTTKVVSFEQKGSEWSAGVSWSLELAEV